MITNERQYKIAVSKAEEFRQSIAEFDPQAFEQEGLDPIFIDAHRDALSSQLADIEAEISQYEETKALNHEEIFARSLADLPLAMMMARIAKGLTQKQFAELVGLKEQQIQRYEAERFRGASLDRLMMFAEALEVGFEAQKKVEIPKFNADEYPFNEMYRRGWFGDFGGSLNEAKDRASELLEQLFVGSGQYDLAQVLHRRTISIRDVDDFALAAWQAKVMMFAQLQPMDVQFDIEMITGEWVAGLVYLSVHDDGPVRAREKLMSAGIHFVYEPHLPGTHLDGAAMVALDENPIIGMTLRYDRIDNFWFTLLHELGHVVQHIATGIVGTVFDDMEAGSDTDLEKEANEFAEEALISAEDWAGCVSRFSPSRDTVDLDAERIGISPAIIAGRIRKQMNDYTLLGDLIGDGQVRVQFANLR